MRWRSRLLWFAKWGAVLVCGLSFAIGVVSIWFGMALHLGDYVIDFAEARIGLLHIEGMDAGVRGVIDRLDTPHIGLWFINESTSSVQQFYAPIWLLLLLLAALALVLSRLVPRHCLCGYDLRGNVNGTCPECGRKGATIIARRRRTFILAGGITLCMLIAAAFLASARRQIVFQVPSSRGPALYLVAGSAAFVSDEIEMLSAPVSAEPHSYGLSRWNLWAAERIGFVAICQNWDSPDPVPTHYVYSLRIPIYAMFASVAVPTLLVWRFWPKRPKPGHCRCGYNLRGLTEARCPECGIGFDPRRCVRSEDL